MFYLAVKSLIKDHWHRIEAPLPIRNVHMTNFWNNKNDKNSMKKNDSQFMENYFQSNSLALYQDK